MNSTCKRLALTGPETMTDAVYYDVRQWYVDINAVKLTRIVWTDIGTIPWQPCIPWTWHCNVKDFSYFLRFGEQLWETSILHLHASDAEQQANCQSAEWHRLCRCQLSAGHCRLGAIPIRENFRLMLQSFEPSPLLNHIYLFIYLFIHETNSFIKQFTQWI